MKAKIPLFALCIFSLSAAHAADQVWRADLATTEVRNLYLRHGESADLVARLYLHGRAYNPTNAVAYYQTNGMARAWWSAPCSIASNTVKVAWTPQLDPGADLVSMLIRLDDSAYRAAAMLYLRPSPGAEPNILPSPTQWIDFDKVAWTNAPWALASDTTLTERGLSDWTMTPSNMPEAYGGGAYQQPTLESTDMPGGGYEWYWVLPEIGVAKGPFTTKEEAEAQTSLTFVWEETVTATRTALPGYILGSQSDKPIAPAGDYALKSDLARAVDYSSTNAVLVATIQAVAAAPGDYATVSNRAMNAVAKSGDTMTGDLKIYDGSLTVVSSYGSTTAWDDGKRATLYWPNFIVDYPDEGGENILNFPDKSGTFATMDDIIAPDYSSANAALVATIQAVAPEPGDYATVSNRAMSALQTFTEVDPEFSFWKDDSTAVFAGTASTATYASAALESAHASRLGETGGSDGEGWTARDLIEYTDSTAAALSYRLSLVGPAATNYTDAAVAGVTASSIGALTSETDPTVPAWAKAQSAPAETDPTVPSWAKSETPPPAADPALASNLVAQVVAEAGQSAAATETWRIVLADHQRRLDALEDADGTDVLTEAQAEAIVDAKCEAWATNAMIPARIAYRDAQALAVEAAATYHRAGNPMPLSTDEIEETSYTSSAAVSIAVSPGHATRYYRTAAASSTLSISSFTGANNNPSWLLLSGYGSVSWPSGSAYSGSAYPGTAGGVFRVFKLNSQIYIERVY